MADPVTLPEPDSGAADLAVRLRGVTRSMTAA